MERRIDMHWTQEPFRSGDRVVYRNMPGTVRDVYPDGVHVVQLDQTDELVAAVEWQLKPQHRRGQRTHSSYRNAI
jgi:hypothetical protein